MKDLLDTASERRDTYGIVGRAHYLAADHKRALNRYFGIPVIVITAVVGTTIFGTLNASPDPFWRIAAGLVSLAGTILSSLQTALGFAQDAEKHKAAGETYRAVHRSFEMFSLKYAQASSDQRQAAFADLDELVRSLKDLPKEFPTLPDRFYNKAKKEHDAENPKVSAQQGAQTGGLA
jgi:hypothetical protein